MTHHNRTDDADDTVEQSDSGDGWEMREGRWQDSSPEAVDHVISDPPFDERSHKNGRRGGNSEGGIYEAHEKSFDSADPRDFASQLVDIARRWVLCFCAVEQFAYYREAVGEERYFRSGAWVKPAPTPQFTGDRPGVWGEGIAIMHSRERDDDGTLVEPPRWNGGGSPAMYEFAVNGTATGDMRVHETQKPLDLMVALVEDFTDPGDLVWDPYAGSATTGVACIVKGREFLGHEMQSEYFDVAVERLRAESKGLKLSDSRAGQTSLLEDGHE